MRNQHIPADAVTLADASRRQRRNSYGEGAAALAAILNINQARSPAPGSARLRRQCPPHATARPPGDGLVAVAHSNAARLHIQSKEPLTTPQTVVEESELTTEIIEKRAARAATVNYRQLAGRRREQHRGSDAAATARRLRHA